MYGGSCSYLWHVYKLREALGLTHLGVIGSVCNAACWPCLWSISIACLLDETPSWLLEVRRASDLASCLSRHRATDLAPCFSRCASLAVATC